jgi:hypothetical protein
LLNHTAAVERTEVTVQLVAVAAAAAVERTEVTVPLVAVAAAAVGADTRRTAADGGTDQVAAAELEANRRGEPAARANRDTWEAAVLRIQPVDRFPGSSHCSKGRLAQTLGYQNSTDDSY